MKLPPEPINIDQLPIPHWGLVCPKCSYSLRYLPSHRCPECGTIFEMNEVIQTYTKLREPVFTGAELPLPDFSLHCKKCKAPLADASSFHCPQCSRPFAPKRWQPRRTWFKVSPRMRQDIPQEVIAALLEENYVPYILDQSRDPFGFSTTRLLVAKEFFFDLLWILTQTRSKVQSEIKVEEPTTWHCESCQEQNPGHFELCWQCQHSRDMETPQ